MLKRREAGRGHEMGRGVDGRTGSRKDANDGRGRTGESDGRVRKDRNDRNVRKEGMRDTMRRGRGGTREGMVRSQGKERRGGRELMREGKMGMCFHHIYRTWGYTSRWRDCREQLLGSF